VEIRPARIEEWAHLEDLQRRASLQPGPYHDQLVAHPDAIALPTGQIERGQVTVAEIGGRIAGFAALVEQDGKLELDGLFVEPELWRNGIGSALVADAVHQARQQGLALTVVASPEGAAFYEKCGFAVEGETGTRFGPAVVMSR
jgi:N-acetylglutamate synthase-like GNAT family acetyltransferase